MPLEDSDVAPPRVAAALGAFCLAVAAFAALAACGPPSTPPWRPASGRPAPTRVRLPVEGRAQRRSLSCESRSACDLLGWHSVRVEEETFLAGLPRSDNPEEGFVGDVDGPAGRLPPEGYGVYEEPIAARLRAFGVPARAVRGRDLAWLRDQLARGRPVIVWATAMLDAPPAVRLQDGRGRAFPAVAYEHTFLAVGYDRATLLLLDSGTGEEERVSAERFDASWAVLGRRAVVVEADRGARGGARVGDGCGARRRE